MVGKSNHYHENHGGLGPPQEGFYYEIGPVKPRPFKAGFEDVGSRRAQASVPQDPQERCPTEKRKGLRRRAPGKLLWVGLPYVIERCHGSSDPAFVAGETRDPEKKTRQQQGSARFELEQIHEAPYDPRKQKRLLIWNHGIVQKKRMCDAK